MKLLRIFHKGKVINDRLYEAVKNIDLREFPECELRDFKDNCTWWCIEFGNIVIAYCGVTYLQNEDAVFFTRAWVHKTYRGRGIQKRMIRLRLKAAIGFEKAVTYTTNTNVASANSLIKLGFKLYLPMYYYAGSDKIYFYKELK